MSQFADVYFYIFSYDGELGGWNKSIDGTQFLSDRLPRFLLQRFSGAEKVMHGEDLYYTWVHRGKSSEDISTFPQSDQDTSARLVTLWTNFVKYL